MFVKDQLNDKAQSGFWKIGIGAVALTCATCVFVGSFTCGCDTNRPSREAQTGEPARSVATPTEAPTEVSKDDARSPTGALEGRITYSGPLPAHHHDNDSGRERSKPTR